MEVGAIIREVRKNNGYTQVELAKKIGIAVGSRGIDRIQKIVRMTVQAVREAGGDPYIFAAMGSHGNGTARGQREILASLGVTEEETGAPVLCSAQTALWGATGQHGYKVYGADGCQITTEAAAEILAEIEKLDIFADIKTSDFEAGMANGSIQYIPDEVYTAFVEQVKNQSVLFGIAQDGLQAFGNTAFRHHNLATDARQFGRCLILYLAIFV